MSSRNPSKASSSDPSFKGKGNLDADDGWEVYSKKTRNKSGSSGSSQQSGPPPHLWGVKTSGTGTGTGRGRYTNKLQPSSYSSNNSQGVWSSATHHPSQEIEKEKAPVVPAVDDDDDDDYDVYDDSDDDDELIMSSDDADDIDLVETHEKRKKNRWFKDLFVYLDGLTIEQINDPGTRLHCPACKGGAGAIDFYNGVQPLIAHAMTKTTKRVKLHRELAQLLDEELQGRGTSTVPTGESFGRWKGLEERTDHEIVWPPMVMITNTRHDKDDNDKWIGMGNEELLDYFSSYSAVKARHSYGPQGHRGISVLIFEGTAVGYMEAERLSEHFEDTGKDRVAWGRNRMPFHPGGQRQLYGFLANKQDLQIFNNHSQGKSILKYEMKSYREMVVNQLKQMSEDNQQLVWLKNKVAKEQRSNKALKESFGVQTEKYRKVVEENRLMKLRIKMHHEQNKAEMDFQEQFYNAQFQQIYDDRNAKEESFEITQQDKLEKLTATRENLSSTEERVRRAEEIASFIQLQDKEMEEFVSERDKLVKAHEQRLSDLMRQHFEEMMDLEKQFDADFDLLLEKFSPNKNKQ